MMMTISRQILYLFTISFHAIPLCVHWYRAESFSAPSHPFPCSVEAATRQQPFIKNGTCPPKHFRLSGMTSCQPWLTNADVKSPDFQIGKRLKIGGIKTVHLAVWKGHDVVFLIVRSSNEEQCVSFQTGPTMLAMFDGFPLVNQLVGIHGYGYISQFHPLGGADQLPDILDRPEMVKYKTLEHMMGLCVDYVTILDFLHSSPTGSWVMCDTDQLPKTLSQYLLTDDFRLILNDVDNLLRVNRTAGQLGRCFWRHIHGTFASPEEVWQFGPGDFDMHLLPLYDEKTDIWKIPSVCEHFLSHVAGHEQIVSHLTAIHSRCKARHSFKRPSAREVLEVYKQVSKECLFTDGHAIKS